MLPPHSLLRVAPCCKKSPRKLGPSSPCWYPRAEELHLHAVKPNLKYHGPSRKIGWRSILRTHARLSGLPCYHPIWSWASSTSEHWSHCLSAQCLSGQDVGVDLRHSEGWCPKYLEAARQARSPQHLTLVLKFLGISIGHLQTRHATPKLHNRRQLQRTLHLTS